MRCPHCSAEQPGGVTVCGFCGAVMVGGSSPFRAAAAAAAAEAEAAPRRAWRWMAIMGAALAVGLAVGFVATDLARTPAADADAAPQPELTAPEVSAAEGAAPGSAASEGSAAADPAVARGRPTGPLTVAQLEGLAERIAALAADGDSRALAAAVDPRVRYRATMEDAFGRRELDGGKPELLAHWLTAWLVAEREGGLADEAVEIQSARIAADPRQGIVVRRLQSGGDPTRVRYPRELLAPLAFAGALAPRAVAELDLAPFSRPGEGCVATETMRVALSPTGLRVIEVERFGRCE